MASGAPFDEAEARRRRLARAEAMQMARSRRWETRKANMATRVTRGMAAFAAMLAALIVYGWTAGGMGIGLFIVSFLLLPMAGIAGMLLPVGGPDVDDMDKAPPAELPAITEAFLDRQRKQLPRLAAPQLDGIAVQLAALEKQLAYEMLAYSPEELIAEAEKQFAWCEKEMLKASNELGFGNDWKAALEMVKNTYLPAGAWPQEVVRLGDEAIDLMVKNDWLTVPPLAIETWRTSMISAERQRVSPFFLGGEVIQIAYPTSEMSHEDKMMSMRGNNPHFSRATVQHELIPGHHLQQFMNQRYMTHRRPFGTPFWTEGWALYWEFVLWDRQFPRDAKDKVGMLFWRMHRAARIIFSLNYHLGKMTPQQCIDLLVNRVGHEPANASAEVRRSFEGSYGPLYQIAYMIGALEIYALRKEMVDSGKMPEKTFHDLILTQNAMPIEILRAKVTGKTLSKDHRASWKFLD